MSMENTGTFKPEPLDTSEVVLYDKHLELVEMLAVNEHNTWASEMVKSGWTYGEVPDAIEKTTPQLVPFDELPEENKEYNRDVAAGFVKNLLKLGYTIIK